MKDYLLKGLLGGIYIDPQAPPITPGAIYTPSQPPPAPAEEETPQVLEIRQDIFEYARGIPLYKEWTQGSTGKAEPRLYKYLLGDELATFDELWSYYIEYKTYFEAGLGSEATRGMTTWQYLDEQSRANVLQYIKDMETELQNRFMLDPGTPQTLQNLWASELETVWAQGRHFIGGTGAYGGREYRPWVRFINKALFDVVKKYLTDSVRSGAMSKQDALYFIEALAKYGEPAEAALSASEEKKKQAEISAYRAEQAKWAEAAYWVSQGIATSYEDFLVKSEAQRVRIEKEQAAAKAEKDRKEAQAKADAETTARLQKELEAQEEWNRLHPYTGPRDGVGRKIVYR